MTTKLKITKAVPEIMIVIQCLRTLGNSANSVAVVTCGMIVGISMIVEFLSCRAMGLGSPESMATVSVR